VFYCPSPWIRLTLPRALPGSVEVGSLNLPLCTAALRIRLILRSGGARTRDLATAITVERLGSPVRDLGTFLTAAERYRRKLAGSRASPSASPGPIRSFLPRHRCFESCWATSARFNHDALCWPCLREDPMGLSGQPSRCRSGMQLGRSCSQGTVSTAPLPVAGTLHASFLGAIGGLRVAGLRLWVCCRPAVFMFASGLHHDAQSFQLTV
jgi:hypothetical protein